MSNDLKIKVDLLGTDQVSKHFSKFQKVAMKANEQLKVAQSNFKALEKLQKQMSAFKKLGETLKAQTEQMRKMGQVISENKQKYAELEQQKSTYTRAVPKSWTDLI